MKLSDYADIESIRTVRISLLPSHVIKRSCNSTDILSDPELPFLHRASLVNSPLLQTSRIKRWVEPCTKSSSPDHSRTRMPALFNSITTQRHRGNLDTLRTPLSRHHVWDSLPVVFVLPAHHLPQVTSLSVPWHAALPSDFFWGGDKRLLPELLGEDAMRGWKECW